MTVAKKNLCPVSLFLVCQFQSVHELIANMSGKESNKVMRDADVLGGSNRRQVDH